MNKEKKIEATDGIKKSISDTTRAISGNDNLKIKFSADPSGDYGEVIKLPQISKEPTESEILKVRGAADSLALQVRFKDEENAIELMNDNSFGLAAGIFTENNGIAMRVSKAVEAGIVFVNTYRLISPVAPFGGFKNSGYGRESGLEVMKDYSNTKTTWINTSTKEIDDPFIIR